jgi:aryl-alcohol dehydrogenase-like predicted oxidoreductase
VCRALWLQERLHAAPLIAVQNPYSLLDRGLEGELFPLVRHLGLGVMAYSPLAIGLLSGAYRPGVPPPAGSYWANRPPEAFARALAGRAGATVEALHDVAQRSGATPAQVALAWVLAQPEVTVAISGADTDAQMAENLGAVDVRLAPDDLAVLDRVSSGRVTDEERP